MGYQLEILATRFVILQMTKVSKDLLKLVPLLEKLSLIKTDRKMIQRLQEAINLADTLQEVDTKGVKPLITLREEDNLYLREDVIKETSREDILKNSSKVVEDYFVSPPGNEPPVTEPNLNLVKDKKKK